MRVVVLNGAVVPADRASLSIDDPAVRFGEALFETMRVEQGVVLFLERHLDRLRASAEALGIDGLPSPEEMRRDVARAVAEAGEGPLRLRLTASPAPTCLVDAEPAAAAPREGISTVALRGAWVPAHRLAEHKTIAFVAYRRSLRLAAASGADMALLLDAEGALGEASTANAFVVVDGRVLTAPVAGFLPGITRELVLRECGAVEADLPERLWRGAEEIFVTSSVQGVLPVVRVDGAAVGDGGPGPVTRAVAQTVRSAMDREIALAAAG